MTEPIAVQPPAPPQEPPNPVTVIEQQLADILAQVRANGGILSRLQQQLAAATSLLPGVQLPGLPPMVPSVQAADPTAQLLSTLLGVGISAALSHQHATTGK
jgi:hypothetical protein